MVDIRVTGRQEDIDAATELISRVMNIGRVSRTQTAAGGGASRYITADPDEVSCLHAVAEVVHRGATEVLGGAGYLVEYGVCVECRDRVVRVRVETVGVLRSVGLWSELVEVSIPKACTRI